MTNEARSGDRTVGNEALSELRTFIQNHRVKHPKPGAGFAEFERGLHDRVMRLERELVAEELERADIDVGVVCVDGIQYRRAYQAEEDYMTVAGKVRVSRTVYRDRADPYEPTLVPLEGRVGMVGGFWTPLAAEQALWVVSEMTPQRAEELFERMGNMEPSKASLDRLPKEVAARWEDDRVTFEDALRETQVVPRETASMVISLDGVYAPMKDTDPVKTRSEAAAAGKIAKGPAGYREVGCATLSFCDAKGEMLAAVRFARMPEAKKETLKESLVAEVQRAMERSTRPIVQVTCADGTEDNWEFLERAFPRARHIVDFFHAAEHLNAALAAVYGDGTVQARERFATLRHVLLEQQRGADRVIRALRHLAKVHPNEKRVRTELAYFRKHAHRMRYAEMRAEGLPIGSGVVEAACKTLVTQRMKNSGMRWSHEGGQAILNVRGWVQSDRFDKAWAMLAATYQLNVTLLNNVVPFRSRAA